MSGNEALDKKVLDMMAKVKAKRAEIRDLAKPQWKTTCSLQLPGWDRLNIQVETDINRLALAFGTLRLIGDGLKIAAKELDCKIDLRWNNYGIEDWLSDIQQQVKRVGLNEEKKKLAAMETKLNTLMSPEQRRQMELEDLEKELG